MMWLETQVNAPSTFTRLPDKPHHPLLLHQDPGAHPNSLLLRHLPRVVWDETTVESGSEPKRLVLRQIVAVGLAPAPSVRAYA